MNIEKIVRATAWILIHTVFLASQWIVLWSATITVLILKWTIMRPIDLFGGKIYLSLNALDIRVWNWLCKPDGLFIASMPKEKK